MSYWAGILLVSGEGDLRQNGNLLGKRFSDLTADGDSFLATCSDGIYSLLDHTSEVTRVSDQPFKSISGGKGFTVAVRDTGALYSWGTAGDHGQLGQGAQNRKVFEPLEIKYKSNIQSVSCGEGHSLALDEDGTVHAWGDNSERQLNIYTKSKNSMSISASMIEEIVFNPRIIPWTMKTKLQKVSCGKRFTAVITKEGRVFTWGAGECGQLGNGRCTMRDLPAEVTFPNDNVLIQTITCGDGHCLAVDTDNKMYSWGLNQRGQLGLQDYRVRHSPCVVSSSSKFVKVYSSEHCSAAIDVDGQLWTWGSTSHDRLMHYELTKERPHIEAPDVPFVPPAQREVLHGISTPTMVDLPGTQGLKFELFAFSKTKSAAIVRTKLLEVSPNKGPKRTFSKLVIHGYGLWDSSSIIVKFTSKAYSIYNPPRAVVGKLLDPFSIMCKPPKFSEAGGYTVSVSLDGGELFLPDTFDINVYKEVSIAQQTPPILDLRSPFIDKLTLKIHGSRSLLSNQNDESLQHDQNAAEEQGVGVKASLYRIHENGVNTLVKEFSFVGQVVSEGLCAPSTAEDAASRPATSHSESAALQTKSLETEFLVECRDIRIPFDDSLTLGLYEMACSVSFNNQDYSGGNASTANKHHQHHATEGGTTTICHAFQAVEARPNCYAISELENVRNQVQTGVQTYLKDMADAGFSIPGSHISGSAMGSDSGSLNGQDANVMEHIPMDQIYAELRHFDRKIVVKAQSLFPSNKLPKGAHIKARIDSIKVVPTEFANNPSPEAIENVRFFTEGIHEHLDPLLVYIDSMELAHFTLTTAFLKLLDDYLVAFIQPSLDRSKELVTLQWRFYLESAALANNPTNEAAKNSLLLLSEDYLPLLLYPASPLSIAPTAMRRHPAAVPARVDESGEPETVAPPARTVSATCSNLVFRPQSSLLRIHYSGAKDKEKDAIVLEQNSLRFTEIIGKIPIAVPEPTSTAAVEEDGQDPSEENPAPVPAEEEYIQGYKVEFDLPEYEVFAKKWASAVTSPEGHVEPIHDLLFSLSLDGTKIPSEANWAKFSFYSDLAKYALQSAAPKGGFTPGSAINLQLEVPCPSSLPISVRLRGADASKAVVVHGQVQQPASGHPTISFSLPDAAGISSNPPFVQGKEKLYYADISADKGLSFDDAAAPLIPIK